VLSRILPAHAETHKVTGLQKKQLPRNQIFAPRIVLQFIFEGTESVQVGGPVKDWGGRACTERETKKASRLRCDLFLIRLVDNEQCGHEKAPKNVQLSNRVDTRRITSFQVHPGLRSY
jgi:hypothetical protein